MFRNIFAEESEIWPIEIIVYDYWAAATLPVVEDFRLPSEDKYSC